MSYRNVALMGKARSGKDSVAKRLVSKYAFTRVSFADPLRDMALQVNPIVSAEQDARLSEVLELIGWERAKDEYPEVRRLLQRMGQTVREYDEDFWVNVAMDKITSADKWNMPVVVTDCRYPNEFDALRNRGFVMARVQRVSVTGRFLPGENGTHESETSLDGRAADRVLINCGTYAELETEADALVSKR